MGPGTSRRILLGDLLVATLLAAVLSAGWAWRDWHQLSALRLPDTDDVMRLQQIRDWLSGQRFGDLAQHRLGAAPGVAMHWSRLPDLVPGGIIAALTPATGAHRAEIAAVILWPTTLFAAALFLVARIASALGGTVTARTAAVVAAIAYPVTTIFLPGRIDHHGLQIVLLLVVMLTLVHPPTLARGIAAGLAAAASVAIGLETVPLLAAAGLAMTVDWACGRRGAEDRMMGFGLALAAGMLGASIVLRTDEWSYPACDGFTGVAWRAVVIAAFAPMAMAMTARERTPPPVRVAIGTGIAVVVGAVLHRLAPQCLTPYGMVDPLLARLWLGRVGEAQPLFAAPPATAIGYAGVMIAGVAASIWALRTTRDPRWTSLLVVQVAAVALTCVQLRGAYAGAILAAPALAAAIAAARARGAGALVAAWLGSAGMLYPLAAEAVAPHGGSPGVRQGQARDCTAPEALGVLSRLPPGRLLAPLDLGAYAIGTSKLAVVGAPYHRNNAGNLAVYRFFLGSPESAASIAQHWRVRYVALCGGSFAELGDVDSESTLAQLHNDRPPAWLHRTGGGASGLTLYTVDPALFAGAPAR